MGDRTPVVSADDFKDFKYTPPTVSADDFADMGVESEQAPQPRAATAPAVVQPQPVRGYVQLSPARNLPEYISKAKTDLGNFKQAWDAMGSHASQRIRELAIDQAADPLNKLNPLVLPALKGVYDQRGQRPSDLEIAGQLTAGAIDYGHSMYAEPLKRGPFSGAFTGQPNADKQPYLEHLRDVLLTYPVTGFMDLSPLIFKGVGGGMAASLEKTAAELERSAAALRPAASAVRGGRIPKLIARQESVARFARNAAHPLTAFEDWYIGGAAGREAVRIFTKKIKLFRRITELIEDQLLPLEKQMSPGLRDRLVLAGERTDDAAIFEVYKDPVAAEYMKRSNAIADWFAHKLIEEGLITEFDVLMAKYGPEFIKLMAKQGKRITAADLPAFEKELRELAAANKAAGKMNVWFRIISRSQVEAIIKRLKTNRPTLAGGISKTDEGLIQPRGKRVRYRSTYKDPVTGKTILAGTVRWAGASFDATNLRLAGAASAAKFLYFKEALEELSRSPAISKLSGRVAEFDTGELIAAAAQATGSISKEVELYIHNLPPGMRTILLPERAIAHIRDLISPHRASPPTRILRAINSWWKVHILGGIAIPNVTFPFVQWLQGGMQYGVAAFRGIQDFARSISALALSMSPKVDDVVRDFMLDARGVFDKPNHYIEPAIVNYFAQRFSFLKPVMDHPGVSATLKGAAATFNFLHDTVPNAVLEAANHADNFWRRAGILYFLLREYESMPGNMQRGLKQAFDLSAQLDTVLKAGADPTIVARAANNLYKFFGHYEEQFGPLQRAVNDYWMWYRWTKHALGLTMAMPAQVPYKTATLSLISKVAPQVLQPGWIPEYMRKWGAVPFYDKDGNVATDEDGIPLLSVRKGLTPFTQTPETLAAVGRLAGSLLGGRGSGTLSPEEVALVELTGKMPGELLEGEAGIEGLAMSPVINMGIEGLTGMSARTGRPMIRPQDMAPGSYSGSSPGALKVILRNLLTPLDRPLSASWEAPYAPSDFSTPGFEHAPKLGDKGALRHGLPMSEEWMLGGKFKPTQMPVPPSQISKMDKSKVKTIKGKAKFKYKRYPDMPRIRAEVRAQLLGQ